MWSPKKKKSHHADGGIFFSDFTLFSKIKNKKKFCNFSPRFLRHTRARRREPRLSKVFGGKQKRRSLQNFSVKMPKKILHFSHFFALIENTNGSTIQLADRPILSFLCSKCRLSCNHFVTKSLATSVPYKHKKVRNFLRHFRTEILRIPTFFLPPKTIDSCSSRRLTLVCRTNCREKLQNSVEGPLFFGGGDQHKIGEKDASISAMTFFFFWRSHWNRAIIMRKFSAFSHWV